MITLLRRHLFDFEHSEARRHAFVALLAVAFLSPDIPMPSPAPALRLEQVLLGLLLPSLFLYYRRHPALRRPMAVDYAFVALGAAMTLSIIAAPIIVSQASYSPRDPFEVARVVEYWLMFRIAYIAPPIEATGEGGGKVLLWAGVGTGAFSAIQYLNIGSFNSVVTDVWAEGHNLDGVIKQGRAVGFVGNANYMGIFSGMLLAFALALILLRHPLSRNLRWLVLASVLLATLGVVTSQSRTAAFSALGAMFLGLSWIAMTWRTRPNYLGTIGALLAAIVLSVTFVQANPPEHGSFADRFNLTALNNDSSVTIRISKLRSLFAGFFGDEPAYCNGENLDDKITKGHEPVGAASGATVPADVLARDTTRKGDVRSITRGILDYYCENSRWPYREASLAEALVPTFMDAVPKDPATGKDYASYIRRDGFAVGAQLENPADTTGPVFALGTVPNIVGNSSFETGKSSPSQWATFDEVDEAAVVVSTADGLFGRRAAVAGVKPTGLFYHLVVYEFPLDEQWTASVWARSASGEDEIVDLYLIARIADGTNYDPMVEKTATLPANGDWVPLSLTFQTPAPNRMFILEFAIIAPRSDPEIKVALDGAALSPGPFTLSYPWAIDVDPARLKPIDLPGFVDSPLLGVGPRKDLQTGAFDNEYALFLDRYGAVGTLAYLALFTSAFIVAFQARKSGAPIVVVLSLAMMVSTFALASFNIAAGSYYHFQIMAIYWLLAGLLARGRPRDAAYEATSDAS
ncbi:MAG: hypothetical protein HY875_12765 [Chloroflexi bacterium]|nr:hypothetical protein [Chloroflexota bacterium]